MRRFALHALHRWTPWVLAAWLCVLWGSGVSPQMHAAQSVQTGEPLCSASHAPRAPRAWQRANSVVEQGHEDDGGEGHAPAHGLDCALCLPWLALPPAKVLAASQIIAAPLPRAVGVRAPWVHQTAAALPARGPPVGKVFNS